VKYCIVALALLTASLPAIADRITEMNRTELCTYTARLKVIGYYYYLQGRPREQVKVNWKGDETRNEIEFVNRTLDEAYAWLSASSADATRLSEQAFGDMVYNACMAVEEP
jgi:hypothetical protein